MTRLYVGNLPRDTTDEMLRVAFASGGRTVTQISIKKNATTGKARGFAFIDVGSQDEANSAIAALHGTPLGGKSIKVNHAKELVIRTAADYVGTGGNYGSGKRGGGRRY